MNEEVKMYMDEAKEQMQNAWSTSKMNWRKSEPAKQTPKF